MRPARCFLLCASFVVAVLGDAAATDSPDGPQSPRLLALIEELDPDKAQTLEDFWRDISSQGTPLVESLTGDEGRVLLTFLWRGDKETRNVVLFSILTTSADTNFSAEEVARSQLVHLPETDIWYRTFTIRADARLSYYLSANDPLLPASGRTADKDWRTLQPDPLNPNRFALPHEGKEWVRSTVELSGARTEQWVVPHSDIPTGHTEMHSLQSTFLQNERRFWVYTPPGYAEDNGLYNLLVLFDGWTFAHMVPTSTIMENLLASDRIDPTIVVMVDQRDRNLELGCHKPFNEFLVSELVPWVRENYNVSLDPAETTVGGASRGGLAAVCAGWRHPEVFGNVLSQSGYFTWDPLEEEAAYDEDLEFDWIIRQLATSPKVDLRLVFSVGTLEHGREFPHSTSLLQANRHMRDVLLAKGYEFTYLEVPGGHEIFSNAMALPGCLIAVADHIRAQKQTAH